MADRIVTIHGASGVVRSTEYRGSDFFTKICLLPPVNEQRNSLRVFFERKLNAKPFWKDVMVFALKAGHESIGDYSIQIDYKVDNEDLYLIASNVQTWFRSLGRKSREFWTVSAKFSLDHTSFTFAELADFSRININILRSYHRNSYRTIWRHERTDPLQGNWSESLAANVYEMHPVVRDEILCLVGQE